MPETRDNDAWRQLSSDLDPVRVGLLRKYGDLSVQRRQAQLRGDGEASTVIGEQQGDVLKSQGELFRDKAIHWGEVAVRTAIELGGD